MTDNVMWRKSSYSGGSGGNCVEVAGHGNRLLVRDTKHDGTGPVLRFTPAEWRRFADQLKRSLARNPDRTCQCSQGTRSCLPEGAFATIRPCPGRQPRC